ncbi:MAG: DUF2520 domain-containing protein, partial [Actinobacteria bacterium]|nr:DUF2520 domain-containing protein [Actinomycetota bacterium]
TVLGFLEALAAALGCRTLRYAAGDRALYHAAAVTASNSVVALLEVAAALWQSAGLERAEALAALLPLTRSALAAVETLGTAQGLTGPVVRGDATTVARHLDALRTLSSEAIQLYADLAQATLTLAVRSGRLEAGPAETLRALLNSVRTGSADA